MWKYIGAKILELIIRLIFSATDTSSMGRLTEVLTAECIA